METRTQIDVERPTGPRVSLREPQSLGQLIFHNPTTVAVVTVAKNRKVQVVFSALALAFITHFLATAILLAASLLTQQQSPQPSTSYTGPGDVVSSALAWYGMRCYTATYVGNVADVYAPADASHTLITCSSGGVLNETLQALSVTCAISCTVKTLYDQTAGSNCSGSCDLLDEGVGRPNLALNSLGTAFGIVCDGGMDLTSHDSFSQATPFTTSFVAKQITAGSFATVIGASNISGFDGADTGVMFNGSVSTISSVADNAFHAAQMMYSDSGGASSADIDGSTTGSLSPGTGTNAGRIGVCGRGGDNGFRLTGVVMEAGIWAGLFSGGQQAAMNSNQHSAYGGW